MAALSWPTDQTDSGVPPPPFPLGNGGLIGTADDWLAFGRMLLAGGIATDGRRLLSADSVQLMITNHTTHAQRMIGDLFLEGQGWGFGGSVDIETIDPWNIIGRYGWVGGTGTEKRRQIIRFLDAWRQPFQARCA